MIIQEPVQAAIWHCLNHYDYKNSIFLAERLCAEVETDETIFLLATSYYRSNLLHQAYWLLREKSRRYAPCRFLLAKCAFQLKKYSEAECVLTHSGFGDLEAFDDVAREFGETACFAFHLMAQICVKTERTKMAGEALRRALKLNPFMWQAYADLCNMGEYPDAATIFQIESTDVFSTCQGNTNTNSMIIFPGGGGAGGGGGGSGGGGNTSDTCGQQMQTPASTVPFVIPKHLVFTTPIDQQPPPPAQKAPTVAAAPGTTPSNYGNLNSSIAMLRGAAGNDNGNVTAHSGWTTPTAAAAQSGNNNNNSITHNISGMQLLEETPVGLSHMGGGGGGGDSTRGGGGGSILDDLSYGENNGAGTPYRKINFKYLSTLTPPTPSFGIMPLNSPMVSLGGGSDSFLNFTNATIPSPQTLAEVNQEQKVITKKAKGGGVGVGGGGGGGNGGSGGVGAGGNGVGSGGGGGVQLSRKEPATNTNTPTLANKPAVFTQTGNIAPRTPNVGNAGGGPAGNPNPNAAVRRSSRLFGGSSYSVKENTKSPNIQSSKFAQPRSPPRKMKSGRTPKILLNNEIIEEKSAGGQNGGGGGSKKEPKEKIETITTSQLISGGQQPSMASAAAQKAASASAEDASKVLLNNSLNSAQTMAHQVLLMKKQSADGLMALLRDLGECYKLLAHYQCKAAISNFEATIPKHHLCSSWIQSLIGMAYYELREYEEAVTVFKRVHLEDPHRLDFMEIYSSSLWHLQQEIELSALAHDVMAQDKMSPVTWCIAGNCFSLHKEHETAIKFFKRAVQVNPDFVYSYTLLGHELVLTEELEKAMDFFRAAVVRDPRHYNAWFGIGTIYSKQEKYALAELHFIRALKINSLNSVILVHIGAMQYFMHKKEQALATLNAAALLEPKNPLARFHRGSIYFSMGKHQEALSELEELKEIVPKESVVFYLIGKIHKTLGNVDLALMHFSWATDLDPKGANNQIKDAFDSVAQPSFCPMNDSSLDAGELDQGSDRSEDSTQAQHDLLNYDSEIY